jgi:hypothetical protein
MSCKYFYKKESLTETELIEVLSRDSAIVDRYRAQEERIGEDYAKEDRATFDKKVKALKKTMNVEVIFDEDIESSRVLGKGDARTKAAGKPVILINPNQLFKTTAIHEFGHIFIDSFSGGLDNPRIIKALEQLEGTALEARVKEMYPELSEDMLKKEILVTAIGSEGSRIWDSEQDMSKWESFKAWFSDFIRRTFGLERNEVEALSKELLNDKVKDIDATRLEKISQQMKPLIFTKGKEKTMTKAEKELETMSQKASRTYENVLNRVTKIYARQKQAGSSASSRKREKDNVKAGKTTRLSSIRDLKEELNRFDEADQKKGFIKYLEWANKELIFMNTKLKERQKDGIDDNTVSKAIEWASSFSILEDIQNMIEEARANDNYFTKEELESMTDVLRELKGKKSQIDAKLVEYSRALFAEKLASIDTETEERAKLHYKEKWAELESAGGAGVSEGEYIIQKLQEDHEMIEDRKLAIAKSRAVEAVDTLSNLSMLFLSEKDMKSKDISLISHLLDKVSRNIEGFNTEEATQWSAEHDAYFTDKGSPLTNSRNMKKKYKGMFTTSKSGQSYYTSEYSPEFLEKQQEMWANASDPEIYEEKFKDTSVTMAKRTVSQNKILVGEYESKVPNSKTGETKVRTIEFGKANNIRIEGGENLKKGEKPTHVVYHLPDQAKGVIKEVRITINEAIARSEAYWWTQTNMRPGKVAKPTDKWLSEEWKELQGDPQRMKMLEELKEYNRIADERYDNRESIITKLGKAKGSAEFMRLPGMMKSSISRVAEGQGLNTMGKAELNKLYETQKDDFDTQSVQQYTDFTDGEALRIPSPYRARLQESDQSFDLHTMGLMNAMMSKNYQEKKNIEGALIVIKEVIKNKSYPVKHNITGVHLTDPQNNELRYESPGTASPEYRKAQSMIENRLYGITTKQAGGIKLGDKTIETQQVVQTGLKYFGAVSLVFNYANSIVNTGTGTFSNLIEAVGGDVYNLKDYKKAQKLYRLDMANIIKDAGAHVKTSRTNMLLNQFNTMGQDPLNNDFEKGTRMEGLANQSTLRPLATMGEHMMQSKVMYAILESIKVQNDKGQWLNADGVPVKDKKKAASMNDMLTFKTDEATGRQIMELHPAVKNTSFTTTGSQEQILLETRNLIRSKVDELHGQYTTDIQADAQRYMLGKMGFFLRKWMIPGYLRRYRGIGNVLKPADADLGEAANHYSLDQKNYMEGYHVTSFRFLIKLKNDLKRDQFTLINSWNELTPKQRAGIRKSMIDLTFMLSVYAAHAILSAGIDDEDEVFWYYVLRRQQSELTFFSSPIEAYKIASTPTAAVGNIKSIIKVLDHITSPSKWGETYKHGERKGESKGLYKWRKLAPWPKGVEDFKQAYDFLNSSNTQGN